MLVDTTKMESPNNPRYVRCKYLKRPQSSSESSDSEDQSTSDDDFDINIDDPNRKNENTNDNTDEVETENNVNPGESLSSVFSVPDFEAHIPKWGASIDYNGLKNVNVTNTCTIDYMLFALWVLHRQVPNFINTLPQLEITVTIKKIIENIQEQKWNLARQLWIVDIMKYKEKPIRNTISMFGSESEMFLKYIGIYQKHNLKQICTLNCEYTNKIINKDNYYIFFEQKNGKLQLHSYSYKKCKKCKKQILLEYEFVNNPNMLLIQTASSNVKISEIPQIIRINDNNFRVMCVTLHKDNHFIGVFELNGKRYVVDDLVQGVYELPSLETLPAKRTNNFYRYHTLDTATSIYYLD